MALIAQLPAAQPGRYNAMLCGNYYTIHVQSGATDRQVYNSAAQLRPGQCWRSDGLPGFRRNRTAPNDKNIPMPVKEYPKPEPLEETVPQSSNNTLLRM